MRSDPNLINPPQPVITRLQRSDGAMSSSSLEALSLSLRASPERHSHPDRRQYRFGPDAKFHLRIAFATFLLVTVSLVGCKLTSIHAEIGGRLVALLTLFAMISPLPLYWHEKGRAALRESVLVLPWELIVALTLPFTVFVAARLRMPLQDAFLGSIDQYLGVSVPAIMAWADHHWLGTVINASYPTLLPLMALACLVPPLTGKVQEARTFLLSNLIAYAIGLPLFAMLPAIGPWSFYHLVPQAGQAITADLLREIRFPGPYYSHDQGAGLVCFPSFHVIWAMLSAKALWGFRLVRIPLALLSTLIILSTLTTGWHYFCDVLAGLVIAVVSLAIARIYVH